MCQSPDVTEVEDFNAPVTLYCIGCYKDCTYSWESIPSSDSLPNFSTPVVYVSRPDLYQCTVKSCKLQFVTLYYKLDHIKLICMILIILAKKQCKSRLMMISITPNTSGLRKKNLY